MTLAKDFEQQGFAFPIPVMSADEAAAIRSRIETIEAGIGKGPETNKLYRFKPHLIFKWAHELVRHPRILDAVEEIIGPDILVWAVGLFIKEPRDPSEIRWHQDGFHMDLSNNDKALRAWVALTETTVENGTMAFVPGSHRTGFQAHAEDDASAHLALRGEHIAQPEGLEDRVPVLLRPGEISLHHIRTVHGSPGNRTDQRRMTVAMTFLPAEVAPRSGRDTATLVRGQDRFGNWMPEDAHPRAEFDKSFLAARDASMAIRMAAYHGAKMPEP